MLLESLIISLLYVLLISFPSNTNCLILSHHHHHKHHPLNSLFIFGDSILDVGNNNYINTTTLDQANFSPYGVNFFHYPTGRFSDGRVISDFITERANLPLIQPYLQPGRRRFYYGVNFASAGGGALVETFKGSVIDLHMQLKNYKKVERWFKNKLRDKKIKRRFKKAVYFFGIGTNDYISLFLTNSSTRFTFTKSQYVSMVISNITSVVNDIYKIGGRKFGFLNLPPVGCLPALRILNSEGDSGCHKEVTSYIRLHNKAILQGLKELEKQLPGFKYALFDYYTSTLQRVNHPSKYVEKLFRHKFGEVEAKKRLTSAVYLFSIGANDYLSLFLTNSSILTTYTKSEYVELVIGNITSVITEIYNTGGRKFAFLNVPKIGCVPVSRISNADGECNTEPSEYAMLHNRALFHVLEELKMKLPGFKYSFYDFYTCAQQRIDYPSKYGFKEGKTACCGTGKFRGIWSCGGTRLVKEFELCENVNDYVFWDSTHFTEKVYEQLADEMWNLHSYGSHSIKELFYLS